MVFLLGAARDYIWRKVINKFPEEKYSQSVIDQIGEDVYADEFLNTEAKRLLEDLGHRTIEENFDGAWEDFDLDVTEIFEEGKLDNEIEMAIERALKNQRIGH